jgi:uncharacterized protein YdhG (YjbR/CyaY superfamily)
MEKSSKEITTIEQYISEYPDKVQEILKKITKIVRGMIPKETKESISYGMPAFRLNKKPLVYYAAFKNHIGMYPAVDKIKDKELLKYKTSTGTFQFQLDEPIPYDLIRKFVEIRLESNLASY